MKEQRYSIPSWNDNFTPQRCDTCGRTLMPSGMVGTGNSAATQPAMQMMDSWNRAWSGMYDAWAQTVTTTWAPYTQQQPQKQQHAAHSRHSEQSERCEDCERDDCDCKCCVGDADLLVYARVGEHRVVPLVIENDSHREKQIELDLSDWSTRNGRKDIQVSAKLDGPLTFTLAGCAEQKLNLLVFIDAAAAGTADGVLAPNAVDVDGCQVYYADLRVKGCDIRPVRIALALLSHDCSPTTIECRCNCC